jgi:hypothetical protein
MRDEIEGLKAGDTIRWAMLTKAEVTIPEAANGSEAVLREGGQQLFVRHGASVPGKFEVMAADPPDNDYDAPNPGMRLLILHLTAPESGRVNIAVTLQPVKPAETPPIIDEKLAQTELSRWPLQTTV